MIKVIAIDGPAGAGKSTISKLLAEKLNFIYIDTGAMYRAVTYLALEKNIDIEDKRLLSNMAEKCSIIFLPSENNKQKKAYKILINDKDVTDKIRSQKINENVPLVSKISGVRTAMLKLQRKIADNNKVVMDGRDIGSKVLPDADLKIFVTANLEERAYRRYHEMKNENNNNNLSFEDIKKDIKKRDKIDSKRAVSPLIMADDAVLIDSTDLTIDDVLNRILHIIKKNN